MLEFLPPDFILLIDQDVSGPTSVKEGLIQKWIVLSPIRGQNSFTYRGNSGFFRKFGPVLILLDRKKIPELQGPSRIAGVDGGDGNQVGPVLPAGLVVVLQKRPATFFSGSGLRLRLEKP